jgi:hypothetical protein
MKIQAALNLYISEFLSYYLSKTATHNNSANLEVTLWGKSWSIQAVNILAVRSDDVAARAPFVFPIKRSAPSDRISALLTWSEPSVHLALHRHW